MTTFLFAKCSRPLPVERITLRLDVEHAVDLFFQRFENDGWGIFEYVEQVFGSSGSGLIYSITEMPDSNHFEDVIDNVIDIHDLNTTADDYGEALFKAVQCLSRLVADILFHDERVVQLFLCANTHAEDTIIRLSGSHHGLAIAMADHLSDLVFLPDLILTRAETNSGASQL